MHKDLENILVWMDPHTQVNGKMINNPDMAKKFGKMVQIIKEITIKD